jgi:hypothetical protein
MTKDQYTEYAKANQYTVIQYDADDRQWYFLGGYLMDHATAQKVFNRADPSDGRLQIQKGATITRDSNTEIR